MVRNSTAARRGLTSITSSAAATRRLNLLSSLLCLLVFTPSSNLIVNAQEEEECSCSPREFFFKLDLSALCPSLPPPFPPNDVFTSGGVADYTCNIGPEPVPKTTKNGGSRDGSTRHRGLRSETLGMDLSEGSITDFFSETEVKDSRTVTGDDVKGLTQSAIVATEDTVPVSIYSVQFLEVDSDFNVIHQDSAYVRNIDFKDGDIFNYTSIIAQDPEGGDEDTAGTSAIPGGMNMVLRGVNAAGDPVRNVFTITYNNDLCGTPTFEGGEAIGWVIFEDFAPATEETCPRSAPTPSSNPPITMFPTEAGPAEEPTTSPPNNEPTTSNPPITEPTPTPLTNPDMSIPYEIDYSAFDHHHHHYYAKSGKGSKGEKSGKGSKGSSHYSYNWGSKDGYRRMR